MNMLNKLVPKFLRQFDQYLLLHYPVIWETRGHYFMFYSLVVCNAIALIAGLLYPVHLGHAIDFDFVQGTVIIGNTVGMVVWAFFVYLQTFRRKLSYNWQESLMQLGVYVLCLASLGVNILLFPNVVRLRAISLLSKDATLAAVHQYSQAKYLDDLAKAYTYSIESEPNAAQYLKAIKSMELNQGQQVEQYFELQKELIKLFDAKTFPEYQQKKKLVDAFIKKYNRNYPTLRVEDISFEQMAAREDAYPELDDLAEQETYEQYRVINPYTNSGLFDNELSFWKEDSTYLAQQIHQKKDWNLAFKNTLIQNNLKPSRVLNLYLHKKGFEEQIIHKNLFYTQGDMMQTLFKRFKANPNQDKFAHHCIMRQLEDLCAFHEAGLFLLSNRHVNIDGDVLNDLNPYHDQEGITKYTVSTWTNTDTVKSHFLSWDESGVSTTFIFLPSILLMCIFLILGASVVRVFNVRNLFLSALLCMLGVWGLAIFAMLVREFSYRSFYYLEEIYNYSGSYNILLMYFAMSVLIVMQGLSAGYFFTVKSSQKWMRTWVASLLSATFLAIFFTLTEIMPRYYYHKSERLDHTETVSGWDTVTILFTGTDLTIMIIAVLGFVLYQAYQRLSYLPKVR